MRKDKRKSFKARKFFAAMISTAMVFTMMHGQSVSVFADDDQDDQDEQLSEMSMDTFHSIILIRSAAKRW